MFNKQLTEEEYKDCIAKLDLHSAGHRAFIYQERDKLRRSTPNIATHQFQTEDCLGDHITESKNAHQCFDIFASEDCYYNIEANGIPWNEYTHNLNSAEITGLRPGTEYHFNVIAKCARDGSRRAYGMKKFLLPCDCSTALQQLCQRVTFEVRFPFG